MIGWQREGGRLLADGASLEEAAQRFGTPLYVYSRGVLETAYDAYASAFAPLPHRICYALKANSSGALLRVLAARGAGADIVSRFELEAALRAGFAPEGIVFSGAGKRPDEIARAVEAGIGAFNAESEDEIALIGRLAFERGTLARVALRVNPDVDARSHPYISTGLRDSKFGVDIGSAFELLTRARQRPGVRVTGVQCHIGSQLLDLDPVDEAVGSLVELTRRLLQAGFELETIDVGGGLGVDYEGGGAPTPAALAARVLPLVAPLGLRLLLEPGRSLVGPAGTLLTRVLQVKHSHGRRFVIVDAGMNDLLRPALYEAFHRIEPVVEELDRATRRVDVVGPVCETGDFLALGRELPEVRPGELLAVRDAGAYGFSMASNYNLRPRPAEVLAEAGALRLVRRRETLEDLLACEE
jgi:diaminopimelate decarboxylase